MLSTSDNKIKIQVFIQLAQIYAYHLNKVKDAVILIKKAINLTGDPSRLIKLNEILGDIYYSNLRDFDNSHKVYEQLIAVKPRLLNHYEYRFRYAESLFLSNAFLESLESFELINQEFPDMNRSKIKYRIALINYLMKKTDRAEVLFGEIIDGDFNYSEKIKSAFYLAGIYEEKNQLKRALKYYQLIKYDYPNAMLINQKIRSVSQRLLEIGL